MESGRAGIVETVYGGGRWRRGGRCRRGRRGDRGGVEAGATIANLPSRADLQTTQAQFVMVGHVH